MSTEVKANTMNHQWRKLLQAIESDNYEAVNSILKNEGWPTDKSFSDYEILLTAAKLGRKEIVHLLLSNNCRVFCGTGINTPMHYAVQQNDWKDVIERLLEKGCRISDVNSAGKTAVHVAYKGKATGEKIDFLLQKYLLKSTANIVSSDGVSTLHIASTRPNGQVVRTLLEADVSLVDQATCKSYHTALHIAVNHRGHEVARALLDHGANIYKRDNQGSTPLHWALWSRDVKMIDMILSYDLEKANVVNKYGLSHFMVACAGSNLSIVKKYIHEYCAGKQTTPQDLMSTQIKKLGSYSGYTPLHFAVEFGSNLEIVRLLLQFKADCCATTCYQITPHSLAVMKGHNEISQILKMHCPSNTTLN